MGASESVPNPDARTLKAMEMAHISVRELGVFWRHFRKADRERQGTVDIDAFYGLFDEKRSIFGDGIFEINDIHHTESIEFGEYLTAVVMYCLFEPPEILKFCMYIFDRDKNGYIERDELLLMLRVLYKIVPPEEFNGAVAAALDLMDFNPDGRVEFAEFCEFHRLFPYLLYPAFRIQLMMITETMGQRWWDRRKRALYGEKQRAKMIAQLSLTKERQRLFKLREKRVRKKMGWCRYCFCPGQRAAFRALFPLETAETLRKMAQDEIEEQLKRQRAIETRIAELNRKNPETPAWRIYKKRKAKHEYALAKKTESNEPERGRRSMTHRERRMEERRAEKIAAARE